MEALGIGGAYSLKLVAIVGAAAQYDHYSLRRTVDGAARRRRPAPLGVNHSQAVGKPATDFLLEKLGELRLADAGFALGHTTENQLGGRMLARDGALAAGAARAGRQTKQQQTAGERHNCAHTRIRSLRASPSASTDVGNIANFRRDCGAVAIHLFVRRQPPPTNSRPIRKRLISLVPAPMSYNLASRRSRSTG